MAKTIGRILLLCILANGPLSAVAQSLAAGTETRSCSIFEVSSESDQTVLSQACEDKSCADCADEDCACPTCHFLHSHFAIQPQSESLRDQSFTQRTYPLASEFLFSVDLSALLRPPSA